MNQHHQTHHCLLMYVIKEHIDTIDVLGAAVSVYLYLEDTANTLIDSLLGIVQWHMNRAMRDVLAVLLLCQEVMQVPCNATVEICQLKAACDGCSMKLPL